MTEPKHYSDEVLLRHLDRELPRWKAGRVAAHLEKCWECRARMAEIEGGVHQLASLVGAYADSGSAGTEVAKRSFLAAKADVEKRLSMAETRGAMGWRPWAWAAAACVVLVAAVAVFWQTRQSMPDARTVLASVATADRAALGAAPRYQRFRLQLEQSAPARTASGSVELWVDPASSRAAARWNDDGGAVRYAMWRPAGHVQYVQEGTGEPLQAAVATPARLVNAVWRSRDLDELQAALVRWLSGLGATPVSLGEEAVTVMGDATLRLERGRLVATRELDGAQLTLVFEWNGAARRVRLERRTSAVTWTLLITEDKSETLSGAQLRSALFTPRIHRGQVVAPLEPLPMPGQPAPMVSVPVATASEQMEIAYLLHKRRLCLGGTVNVERAGRQLVLTGVLPTDEERRELATAIRGLQLDAPVLFQIATPSSPSSERLVAVPGVVARAPRVAPSVRKTLEGVAASDVAALIDSVAVASDDMLAEAWEITRLAAFRQSAPEAELKPQSLWFLEMMIRDHFSALSRHTEHVRRLLGPLLPAAQSTGAAPTGDWATLSGELLRRTQTADAAIQAVFTDSAGHPEAPAAGLRHLAITLEELARSLPAFETALTREFSGDPGRRAHK